MKTHEINAETNRWNGVLQLAITDSDCNRLEESALLIPMIPPGHEIKQVIADFK